MYAFPLLPLTSLFRSAKIAIELATPIGAQQIRKSISKKALLNALSRESNMKQKLENKKMHKNIPLR